MKELAELLIMTSEIRFGSFKFQKADSGKEIINYEEFYNQSIKEAINVASLKLGVDKSVNQIGFILLKDSWSESLSWATELMEKTNEEKFSKFVDNMLSKIPSLPEGYRLTLSCDEGETFILKG